ncbi:MAG: sigma-70 family RNA polymerase sigma factor [bacterium]
MFHTRFNPAIQAAINLTADAQGVKLAREEREDCKQSLWFSLIKNNYKKLGSYRGINGCTLRSWLWVCAVNETRNYLKERKKHAHSSLEDSSSGENQDNSPLNLSQGRESIEEEIAQNELYAIIIHIIEEHLTTRQRLFAQLYWLDGASFDEIRHIMHLQDQELYLLKHRTQKKIKQILKKHFCPFDD